MTRSIRELVKDRAVPCTRIPVQADRGKCGPDEAKMLGRYRMLVTSPCAVCHLLGILSVSIKMAANRILNPTKIERWSAPKAFSGIYSDLYCAAAAKSGKRCEHCCSDPRPA